jgi:hypothetical protein
MANQEFDKTGYTTFGPFFATNYSAPSHQSYSKHPIKHTSKNLTKQVAQLLDHLFAETILLHLTEVIQNIPEK